MKKVILIFVLLVLLVLISGCSQFNFNSFNSSKNTVESNDELVVEKIGDSAEIIIKQETPEVEYIKYEQDEEEFQGYIDPLLKPSLEWIKQNIKNSVFLNWWDYGHMIRGYTDNDVIIYSPSEDILWSLASQSWDEKASGNFSSTESIIDVVTALTSNDAIITKNIMEKYGAQYLFTTKRDLDASFVLFKIIGLANSDQNIESSIFNKMLNKETLEFFELVYEDNFVKIYELVSVKLNKIEIPDSLLKNCLGFYPPFPEEANAIPSTGGGWVRPHPGPFMWGWIEESKDEFNFELIDKWAKQSGESNIAILATIFPFAKWDQNSCHDSTCEVSEKDVFFPRENEKDLLFLKEKNGVRMGIPQSRCVPCNFDDYKNFLKTLVERYDGDGIDDMQDLKIPIKHYEILNEPDLDSPDLTFFKGTHEEYVEILKVSYETIKETCSDCKIVQGGAAGIALNMLDYWDKIFELGGGQYFDIANIHYINYGDVTSLNVKDFKKLMTKHNIEKPIWVTESELDSKDDVMAAANGALDSGAEKLFFSVLVFEGDKKTNDKKKGMEIYNSVYAHVLERCAGD
ncbi:hypothetical protein HOK51_00760 [Candidatus Woesearchaeota archaeon]|jgi:hypothetical protein|nr:hypothetical protein [Candidatus Woesearchaeota archaeon]MBT6518345.1 hypothetical protein [Candidatus Woesearchaeota archaeon]MBT7366642.1 hypothetical protein [Candidatus Woesearchaeota archaeon]